MYSASVVAAVGWLACVLVVQVTAEPAPSTSDAHTQEDEYAILKKLQTYLEAIKGELEDASEFRELGPNDLEKRFANGFFPNRGKKSFSRGFFGVRGKRFSPDFFQGSRGKRMDENIFYDPMNDEENDAMSKKWGASGFFGARGKKNMYSGFFGARGKKSPWTSSFFSSRGKRAEPELTSNEIEPSGYKQEIVDLVDYFNQPQRGATA